jgi:hypothetical protein
MEMDAARFFKIQVPVDQFSWYHARKIIIFNYCGARETNLTKKKSLIMASEHTANRKFDYTLDKLKFMEKII